MSVHMMQRLVDPELCVACFSCYEACPKGAVILERRRVAIDPAVCNQCGDCMDECSTDAIAVLRRVFLDTPYSVHEQLHWSELPPPEIDTSP